MAMLTSSDPPPPHRFTGSLGEELVVISVPMLRAAQRLDTSSEIETADGPVMGRPGDFVVTQSNGERYPIVASVFYGTYQVLGRVGSRFIGKRLLHIRRAWPIVSAHAEFDYGKGRGKVAAPRGGWIYRSDENDYGLINAEAKLLAHIEVGTAKSLHDIDWKGRFRRAVALISLLPPVMSLLALLAFTAASNHHCKLSRALLAAEGTCVLLGAAAVWWIRKDRWVLKRAVSSGSEIASNFQCAVGLLGQTGSDLFPDMALWRAAQSDHECPDFFSSQAIRCVKDRVSAAYEDERLDIEEHHTEEKRTNLLSWIAALIVCACIVCAISIKWQPLELLAIWLPSVVGAMHASASRRQILNRIGAGQEFLAELAFVRSQLMSLVPDDLLDTQDTARAETFCATLRVLCRAAAEHAQRKLQFAIGENPNVAV
jgi:hypothetical protein